MPDLAVPSKKTSGGEVEDKEGLGREKEDGEKVYQQQMKDKRMREREQGRQHP